jgi:hypothetical protein
MLTGGVQLVLLLCLAALTGCLERNEWLGGREELP